MGVLFWVLLVMTASVQAKQLLHFDIPRSPANVGLKLYVEQARRQVLFPYDLISRYSTNAVAGVYSADEALRILLQGTGLGAVSNNAGTLTIHVEALAKGETVMPSSKKTLLGALAGLLTSVFVATPGVAQTQTSQPVKIEEVVVTAQKRQQPEQDVPISVSAFSGQQLKDVGAVSTRDLVNLTPNMDWSGNQGSNVNAIFLRGVGDFSFHTNQVGAVGLYVDEVSLNSPLLAQFALFDMKRVEVLRGPQNTLFGRNTTGGAIQFITNKPDVNAGWNGYLTTTGGNKDRFDVEGAVGIPLGPHAAARIAITRQSRGNYIDNTNLHRGEGRYERYAARGELLWQPTDSIEALLNFHGGRFHGDSTRYKQIDEANPATGLVPCPTFTPKVGNGCSDQTGNIDTANFTKNTSGLPNLFDIDTYGGSLKLDWKLPWGTVSSLTAYEWEKSQRAEDSDAGPSFIFTFDQGTKTGQWSQEVRLTSPNSNRLRWITGFYYFNENADLATAVRRGNPITTNAAVPLAVVPDAGVTSFIPDSRFHQDNTVFSVYGQSEFDVTHKLTIQAGLRYNWEQKKGLLQPGVAVDLVPIYGPAQFIGMDQLDNLLSAATVVGKGPLPILCPAPFPLHNCYENIPFNFIWQEVGGKVSVDYHITDSAMVYGSVSRGFKSGGLSVAALDAIVGNGGSQVVPESLWTYELGLKSQWLNNTVQFNVAVFWNQWHDEQLFLIQNTALGPNPVLTNVPQSSNRGLESTIKWLPAEGWYTSFGVGYLSSRVDDPGTIIGVSKGNRLIGAPDITFNGLVRKEWPLGNGKFALQTTFRHMGSIEYDLGNSPNLREPGYWLLNARAIYRFGQAQRYEVSVWGQNLTGTQYCSGRIDLTGIGFGNVIQCIPNAGIPFFGGTVTVHFD